MSIRITRRGALFGASGLAFAAAACSSGPRRPEPEPQTGPFRHGVASGEPDQSSVVLWTAITDDAGGEYVFQVATDEGFENIVFEDREERTYVTSNAISTFKVIATGLEPATTYFYRMLFNGISSPVGRTRTLPAGAVDRFNMAVCSCSNYPAGYFNAYRELANTPDLDLVLHLGDYLYEYSADGYASEEAERMDRVVDPRHELISYGDYARRHALYKTDPDLQAAHAAAPWLMMWDDHEVANDAWATGAENHNEGEGSYDERVYNAMLAYHDWNPTREPGDQIGMARIAEIGDLATLAVTESRHVARDQPMDFSTFPIPDDADPDDPANQQAIADWRANEVGREDREMLGAAQIAQIADAFRAAAGKPWRLLGGQVVMGRVETPDMIEALPGWLKFIVSRSDELAWGYIQRSQFDIPYNLDAWDGYVAERERLYDAVRDAGGDMIAFAGDSHNFWTNQLMDDEGHRIGYEFGTTSITSPSPFERVPAPGVSFSRLIEEKNPDVLRHNDRDKGFIRVTLTPDAMEAEFVTVSTIRRRGYTAGSDSRWRVTRGPNGLEIDTI
ncbi:alkaline phosphatase D family protein [Hyphobacterium sp.]|uniref:alkaline phosphatase D family protein n=1 Tax=Hyphobacterium sp. TaxID=2004662 RepID=UPI0037479A44